MLRLLATVSLVAIASACASDVIDDKGLTGPFPTEGDSDTCEYTLEIAGITAHANAMAPGRDVGVGITMFATYDELNEPFDWQDFDFPTESSYPADSMQPYAFFADGVRTRLHHEVMRVTASAEAPVGAEISTRVDITDHYGMYIATGLSDVVDFELDCSRRRLAESVTYESEFGERVIVTFVARRTSQSRFEFPRGGMLSNLN